MLTSKDHAMPSDAQTEALIDELAKSSNDAIKQLRTHTRLSVRAKVYVEAASLSQRTGVRLQGVTGDISAGGTQILLARPLAIGDLYQISFDRKELDIPPVYAVCLRGRMVRPDAYEAGLRFLEPITLPSASAKESDPGLIV
jgi:c-di-GMP-binding flagellar brake protein YcgR